MPELDVITDERRLDLLIELGARVGYIEGGGYRVCRNEYGRLKWYGRAQPDPRGAIDTVIKEREQEELKCRNYI